VVDGGGAAGIAIGCFFGGVFVMAAVMWVVNRKKNSSFDSFSHSQQPQQGSLQGFKGTNNPMAEGECGIPALELDKEGRLGRLRGVHGGRPERL